MTKTLYLIQAENDGGRADQIIAALKGSALPFAQKWYTKDSIPFSQIPTVPCLAILVDGWVYKIYADRPTLPYDHNQLVTDWGATPASAPTPAAAYITPFVTYDQARSTLKVLLETNPANWTATQERQAIYGLLLAVFKDTKTGNFF